MDPERREYIDIHGSTRQECCDKLAIEFMQRNALKIAEHVENHKKIIIFEGAFPPVKDNGCKFANGDWNVRRDKEWFNNFRKKLVEIIGDIGYIPFSYGWFRCLDDGGSMFPGLSYRYMCICQKCFREWGQPYYANHCNHKDKYEESLKTK